jgi:hypothetical protein
VLSGFISVRLTPQEGWDLDTILIFFHLGRRLV